MAKKLNQVLAIEKGIKARSYSTISALHNATQKADLLNGHEKVYEPLVDNERQQIPPQSQRVQMNSTEVFAEAKRTLAELFDVTATKDWGNQTAKADLEVDGKTLLQNVPATYLLFLDKQLLDLRTFVEKFVELDPSVDWKVDDTTGLFKGPQTFQMRTEKRQGVLTLAQATDKFPAQAQVITEDVTIGKWSTVRFSGALPVPQKKAMIERIEKLHRGVKQALEAANMTEVTMQSTGDTVLGYIFNG